MSSSSLTSCGVNNNLSTRQIHDLPEEILQEILSRVSAKDVLRCRSVCRKWKALTSTKYFGELHHHHRPNRSSSDDFTLLVEEMVRPFRLFDKTIDEYFKAGKKLYIFDAWREREKLICCGTDYRYIDAYEDDEEDESAMYISGSSCGLVVLYHKTELDMPFSRNFIIINPITGDKVKIKVAKDANIVGQIFGVFFHPILKEFCILWGQTRQPLELDEEALELENRVVERYKLLNLGPSQSRWRNINNQSTHNLLNKHQQPRIEDSDMGTVGVIPSVIILDDVLYWMVEEKTQLIWPNPKSCEEAILGFDTKSEEFHLLPHPSPCVCSQKDQVRDLIYHQRSMHLLDNNGGGGGGGHLSLCQFSKNNAEWLINIWIFEREEYNIINKGSWIKTHTIQLNRHHVIGPLFLPDIKPSAFRPIGMVDEELLLVRLFILGYLFVFNLKLGTCERFESNHADEICETFMCAHSHNLMPLRNSKPEIILLEE